MRKVSIILACFWFLLGGFWFVRAHYAKKIANSLIEHSNIQVRGFPFHVVLDLEDPRLKTFFSLDGTLSIGSSLFARKAWIEMDGHGKSHDINFSGKIKLILPEFWTLIRNRNQLSSFNLLTDIHRLFPRIVVYAERLELNRDENGVFSDQISIKLNCKSSGQKSVKLKLKGAQCNSELLKRVYFSHPTDLRIDLTVNGLLDSGLPEWIVLEKGILSDSFFRNKFSGNIHLGENQADLVFKASQEVKVPYNQEIEKGHISRALDYLGLSKTIKIPERKLFGMVECQGDVHGALDFQKNWELDIRRWDWKFVKYKMNIKGKMKGPEIQGRMDLEFFNYLALKSFIERKHAGSLLGPLQVLEDLGEIDISKDSLKLQMSLDRSDLCKIGTATLAEIIQKAAKTE